MRGIMKRAFEARTGKTGRRRGAFTSGTACAALLLGTACATDTPFGAAASAGAAAPPATASGQMISPAEKAQGAEAHPGLVAEFGGAMTGPQASYVESVGKGIAVQSGLSNARGDFTVTLLNSPVNNAFAIPGGYIYTTRQLTALMNNEAELAAVLGHEVGHVAARHSAKRQQKSSTNALLGALGSILAGAVLGDSAFGRLGQQLFSQGSQLLTLRYSRSQETEADNLGIAYLQRAGYDPRAMGTVLESLARQTALESRLRGTTNQVPEWASTHPDPASRVRAALSRAGAATAGRTSRDEFLSRIDGLTYGDDPKQGIIEGRTFSHPELKLRFQAPEGFYMVNGASSVSINGQSGQAKFAGGALTGSLETYIGQVFASLTQSGQTSIAPPSIQRTTVNGIPAAYGAARVQQSGGALDVVVFAYDMGGGRAYHFLAITKAGSSAVFNSMFGSLQRLSASQTAEIKARKVDVITVKAGDTLASLASRMAYTDAPLDRFLVLNNLPANASIAPGQKVKIVTY